MDDLIEAFQILRKYGNPERLTSCMRGELRVYVNSLVGVSSEDCLRLRELGFRAVRQSSQMYFASYRFGERHGEGVLCVVGNR